MYHLRLFFLKTFSLLLVFQFSLADVLTNSAGLGFGATSELTSLLAPKNTFSEQTFWPTTDMSVGAWMTTTAVNGFPFSFLRASDSNWIQVISTEYGYLTGQTIYTTLTAHQTTTEWHHFLFTWANATGVGEYWIDGTLSRTYSGMETELPLFRVSDPSDPMFLILFGSCYASTPEAVCNQFNTQNQNRYGRVDEITVWNRMLTPEEAGVLWSLSPAPNADGLVLYYDGEVSDGVIPNVATLSGSDYDLVLGEVFQRKEVTFLGDDECDPPKALADTLGFPSPVPIFQEVSLGETTGKTAMYATAAAGGTAKIVIAKATAGETLGGTAVSVDIIGSVDITWDATSALLTATFTAPTPFDASATFDLTITRDTGADILRTLTVSPNQTPVADASLSNTIGVIEGRYKDLKLSGWDPDGEFITAVVTQLPSQGKLYQTTGVSFEPDLEITKVPIDVTNGAYLLVYEHVRGISAASKDSFKFQFRDERGALSNELEFGVEIQLINDLPVANHGTTSLTEDSEPVVITLGGYDQETGDYVSYMVTSLPEKGTLSTMDGKVLDTSFSLWDLSAGEAIVQYATSVISVSSFWGLGPSYHPVMALGGRSTYKYGDDPLSWVPLTRSGASGLETGGDASLSFSWDPEVAWMESGGQYSEYIELQYDEEVFVRAVEIGVPRGMGWIVGVKALHPNGDWVELFRGEADLDIYNRYKELGLYHVFEPDVCQRSFKTSALRIEGDSRTIDDWNYIDYVALYGNSHLPNGVLLQNATQQLLYTPFPDAEGVDTFEFTLSDCPYDRLRQAESNGVVTINIAPVNDAPYVSVGLTYAGDAGSVWRVELPAVDPDVGDTLEFTFLEFPDSGTVRNSVNGTLVVGSTLVETGRDAGESTLLVYYAAPAGCGATVHAEERLVYRVIDSTGAQSDSGELVLRRTCGGGCELWNKCENGGARNAECTACECPSGYKGSRCQIDLSVRDTMPALAITCIAVMNLLIVFVVAYWKKKVIKFASPKFLILSLVGAILAISSIFPFSVYEDDVNSSKKTNACTVTMWLGHLGYIFMLAPLFAKTHRIARLFTNKSMKRMVIKDNSLLQEVGVLVALWVGLLLAWTIAEPPEPTLMSNSDGAEWVECNSENFSTFNTVMLGAEAIFMLWGVSLCWDIRNTPSAFNESKYIGIALYNTFFLGIVIVPLVFLLSDNQDMTYALTCIGVVVLTLSAMLLLLLPKAYIVLAGKENQFSSVHTSAAYSKGVTTNGGAVSTGASQPMVEVAAAPDKMEE